jgi:hypothetical protein
VAGHDFPPLDYPRRIVAAPYGGRHRRMTARKASLPLPPRTPAYVSREVGAAELCVSPETWDRMVAAGELPKADKRFLGTMPRWEWAAVQVHLRGGDERATMQEDVYVRGADNAKAKEKRRA